MIGPDQKTAEAAYAVMKQEIALAKAAGHAWSGLEEVRKARRPKTFAEAAAEYMQERSNAKPSTQRSYQCILNCYLLRSFGKKTLPSITESDIAKFQARLSKQTSNSRTNTVVGLLRSILATALRRGDLVRNPSVGVLHNQGFGTWTRGASEDGIE